MSPAAFEPICKVWLPGLFVNFKAFVIRERFRCFVLWAMFAFFVGLNLQPHVDNNGYFTSVETAASIELGLQLQRPCLTQNPATYV